MAVHFHLTRTFLALLVLGAISLAEEVEGRSAKYGSSEFDEEQPTGPVKFPGKSGVSYVPPPSPPPREEGPIPGYLLQTERPFFIPTQEKPNLNAQYVKPEKKHLRPNHQNHGHHQQRPGYGQPNEPLPTPQGWIKPGYPQQPTFLPNYPQHPTIQPVYPPTPYRPNRPLPPHRPIEPNYPQPPQYPQRPIEPNFPQPPPFPQRPTEVIPIHIPQRPYPSASPAPHHHKQDSYDLRDSIPGVPGKDYPIYSVVPPTGFKCHANYPGFFADMDAGCQVWHYCQIDGRQDSFLCPNGTIFNQKYFVCDWWYNVNCESSRHYYPLNGNLYQEHETKPYYTATVPVPEPSFRPHPVPEPSFRPHPVPEHPRPRPAPRPHHPHVQYEFPLNEQVFVEEELPYNAKKSSS